MSNEKQKPEWRERLDTALSNTKELTKAESDADRLTNIAFTRENPGTQLERVKVVELPETAVNRAKYIEATLGDLGAVVQNIRSLGNPELAQTISQKAAELMHANELKGTPRQIAEKVDTFGEAVDVANNRTPNDIRKYAAEYEKGNRFANFREAVDYVLEQGVAFAISKETDPSVQELGVTLHELIARKLCLNEISKKTTMLVNKIDQSYTPSVEVATHGYFNTDARIPALGY